ncbi:MAG: phosphate ABC transporter permease PstA [Aquisalimonadaceae bacterium]
MLSVRRQAFSSPGELALTVGLWSAAVLLVMVSLLLLGPIVIHGLPHFTLGFLTGLPQNAGLEGGIYPILLGTVAILAVTLVTSVPLSLCVAVFLSEFARPDQGLTRTVLASLDVMAAVPSIVYGLFGNVLFCQILGFGYSILSGGLTLACMVLPLLIRASTDALLNLPRHLREGGLALGLSKVSVIWFILLPTAAPSLIAAFVLATARALSETAALLFTAGYVDRVPASPLDSARTISVHIYELSMNVPGGEPRAYGAAFVLIVVLLLFSGVTRVLTQRWMTAARVY